ncbi:MAG: type II secretion system minor pseudopilin GspI [Brevundimonas sp.]
MTRSRSRDPRAGFSLLETLVAFAVFALAALALINLAGENTRAATHVETRVLSGIVADNIVVQALTLPNPPAFGEAEGETVMGDRTGRWVQTVATTPDAGMVRIEVRVFDGAQETARLTAFRDSGA